MKLIFLTAILVFASGCLPHAPQQTEAAQSATAVDRGPFDPQLFDKEVAFHLGRVKRDPKGAIGWSMLAGAYLRRASLFDSTQDAIEAESAARQSLALRTKGNPGAANRVAQALLDQHRFKDAAASLQRAVEKRVADQQTSILLAQTYLELGRYDDADKIIHRDASAFQNPSGWPVIARVEELKGHPSEASTVLFKARDMVIGNADVSRDAVAWFLVKSGDLLAATGKAEDASKSYLQALDQLPIDYKAMVGLTKLAAGRGDWKSVIEWGEKTNKIVRVPDVEALMGDAALQLGDQPAADRHFLAVAEIAGKSGGAGDGLHATAAAAVLHGHTLDRQYAIFCADHDRDLESAYGAALRDFTVRQDIYAYDTLAWVDLKMNRPDEAALAIKQALKLGTKDARMLFHAGAIYAALHDDARAAGYWRQALSINPSFNALQAADAKARLAQRESRSK